MSAVPRSIYKECSSCGRAFDHRSAYESQTRFIGFINTGKYADKDLELRNCCCGTTLATYAEKDEDEQTPRWPVVNGTTKCKPDTSKSEVVKPRETPPKLKKS